MKMHLEFEKPIVELERKILELKEMSNQGQVDLKDEIKKMENKLDKQNAITKTE